MLVRTLSRLAIYPLTIAMFVAARATASAEEQQPIDGLTGYSPMDAGSIITVIVVLVLIIALIVITIRLLAFKNKSMVATRAIQHLGGVGVGQNKSVQMMKIGDHIYIVGVGENVQLLEKVEQPEHIEAILTAVQAQSMSGRSLLDYVQNRFGGKKRNADKPEQEEPVAASSFQEIFYDKMKQVGHRNTRLQEMLDKREEGDGHR